MNKASVAGDTIIVKCDRREMTVELEGARRGVELQLRVDCERRLAFALAASRDGYRTVDGGVVRSRLSRVGADF